NIRRKPDRIASRSTNQSIRERSKKTSSRAETERFPNGSEWAAPRPSFSGLTRACHRRRPRQSEFTTQFDLFDRAADEDVVLAQLGAPLLRVHVVVGKRSEERRVGKGSSSQGSRKW